MSGGNIRGRGEVGKYKFKLYLTTSMRARRVVGPKGQVVIPKHMRDLLGLREGTEVVVELVEGGVLIRKRSSLRASAEYVDYYVQTTSPKLRERVDLRSLLEREVAERLGVP